MDYQALAQLLFPHVTETPEEVDARFPARELPEGAIVSRMARYFAQGLNESVVVPNGRQQQLISIGVLICCIPLIVLYCFTQKTFVQSLAMTGSKE